MSSLPPEYTNEINTLSREISAQRPTDVLQFCFDHFARRLSSQRAEFLLLPQNQQAGVKGAKAMTSTFPGSNPFGAPGLNTNTSGSNPGGPAMARVKEEDENEVVASPTAAQFKNRAALDGTPGGDGGASSGSLGGATGASNGGSGTHISSGMGGASSGGTFGSFGTFGSSLGGAGGSGSGGAGGGLGSSSSGNDSFPSNYNLNRRTSVSAESLNPASDSQSNWTPPSHPKTGDQMRRLRTAVSGNFLFSHLDDDQSSLVLGALQEKPIPAKGIKVITQGDAGDFFYVVEKGAFDIYVNPAGALQPGPDGMGNKVGSVGPGGSFGELALMYNAPRAATVVSTEPSTLWALDRVTFRRILMDSAFQRRRMYEKFLEEVPLLASLVPYERSKIADALESVKYPPGSSIIREGDVGESFFILEAGEAEVYKRSKGDRPIHKYGKGDYFGELALLNDAPRAATVVSATEVKLATLDKNGFQRLLGPVTEIMRRNDPSKVGPMGEVHQ